MPGPKPSTAPVAGAPARRTVLRGGAAGLVGAAVLWGASACRLRIGQPAGSGGSSDAPTATATASASQVALDAAAASAAQLLELYGQAAVVLNLDLAGHRPARRCVTISSRCWRR